MIQMGLWRRWRANCDIHVAVSEATRQRLLAEGIAPITVVPNGIRVSPAHAPLAAPPLAAFAGRLVEQKGADILIRAFASVVVRVPQARLLIAGEGPEEARLRQLISFMELGPSVELLGHLTGPEMDRRLGRAWVHVVPSRWAEAFGLTAIEAMMRGTPVVASRCDGLAEIVREGVSGYLVPPGNPDALAEALCRLLQDRALAESMGAEARRIAVGQYAEEHWVDRILDSYRVLLGNQA